MFLHPPEKTQLDTDDVDVVIPVATGAVTSTSPISIKTGISALIIEISACNSRGGRREIFLPVAATAATRFLAEQPDQYPDYHGREDDENRYVLPELGLHVPVFFYFVPVFLLIVCSYLFV